MYFMKSVALATLLLYTSVDLSTEVKAKPVIYVDMKNGTLDSSCWRRGLDLPCGSLELAIAGARKHNSTIAVLPFEVPAAASQEVQPSSSSCPPWFFPDPSSNDTCRCGESIHGAVKCNETLQESAILDCYCVTYNESTGVVAGPCFYNCENIPKGQEDTLYHPLPHRVEELNSAMCGQFHRGGQLVDLVRKDTAHLFTCMICSALTVLIATTTGSSMSLQHLFPSQFSMSSSYGAGLVLPHQSYMLLLILARPLQFLLICELFYLQQPSIQRLEY